ncbi:hypothetical protein ACFOTA_17070 [Chitinophaga sp. GCM10012297]|uniref:Alpha-L-rhamnosidase six-hairpin glycosidase domain-containing protein n=1 Tax=Chitinophaga chungangae TaxID=2821488 RepID=A0ABS3YGW9_9BACT|nr:hypothetical protein [Chitinophaga chungangae]MBO9153935.1 hypothetical protein [Chitinophaga chungangae]
MNGFSPWYASVYQSLTDGAVQTLYNHSLHGYSVQAKLSEHALWLVIDWPKGGSIALRTAYAPDQALQLTGTKTSAGGIRFLLGSPLGEHVVDLKFDPADLPLFHCSVSFTPTQPLMFPFWPRDLVMLGKSAHPSGHVHISQKGHRSGLLYFSLTKPVIGSVLYFQHLGSLKDYNEDTHTEAADTVGGQWPEIGFALPAGTKPLKTGKNYMLSNVTLLLSDAIPKTEFEKAEQFLQMLSEIYLHMPKPGTDYHNWPDILQKSLHNLQHNPGCWQQFEQNAFLNAYVSDYKTPPEIMVQMAVLLPLMDYAEWSRTEIALVDVMKKGIPAFFDDQIDAIGRWLTSQEDKLDQSEEHKKTRVMDSWYLHHPLLNLSRLAEKGDKMAKDIFLTSLEFVIKVARHFKYEWPVFYNLDTLEVVKAETQPGKGGEKDVAGIYAHILLQAYELTGLQRYLTEAKKAARSLNGKGFDLFYQANNTAFTAKALLKLFKFTGDKNYLRLSYLCLANLLRNTAIWDCQYGNGKNISTFFTLFPLDDAPYTAVYEELECFSSFHEYIRLAQDVDILPSISLLLAEYVRYMLHRAIYYYPPALPEDMISKEPKTGEIDKRLWIPLEDLQFGFNQSGTVGQEVYGAGLAFAMVPRHYFKLPHADIMLFIDYPTFNHKNTRSGSLQFDVKGDQRLTCRMIFLPLNGKKTGPVKVTGRRNEHTSVYQPRREKDGSISVQVHGNQKIIVELNKTIKHGKRS